MNYFIWIFLSLLVITLTLYIIFYNKKQKIVFSLLIIPFTAALLTSILTERFPDSARIIQVQILVSLLTEIIMLLQLKQKKSLKPLAMLLYLFIFAVWNSLYFPAMYIIRIPAWFSVIFTIIMTFLFLAFCFIARNKSFILFIFYALSFFAGGQLLHIALAELIFTHRLYSIPLAIGSITSLIQLLIYSSETYLITKKYSQLIFETSYLLSFAIVSAAGILMIF